MRYFLPFSVCGCPDLWHSLDFPFNFIIQACHISGFRPEITGFFIALPALRLSHENLRQNHKISGIFSPDILTLADNINWLERHLKSHFTVR